MEVSNGREVFQVKKLLLDRPVHGLDIAVITPGFDRDTFVPGPESLHDGSKPIPRFILSKAADELRAVIGLNFQFPHVDAAGLQMAAQKPGKQTGIVSGFLVGIGQEHHAAADLTGGKLIARQAQGLPLRPVMGDIDQVLGIYRKLSKQLPVPFDMGQVLFLLVLFSSFLDQAIVFEDPADGLMGARQAVLSDQPTGPHEGISCSQGYDLPLEGGRDLVRTGFGNPWQFLQTGQTFLPEAAQPLADGLRRGLKRPGGRLDAVLLGESDHPQAQFKLVSFVFHAYNLFIESKRFTEHTRPFFGTGFFERKQNAERVSVFQVQVFLGVILEPQYRRLGAPQPWPIKSLPVDSFCLSYNGSS